LAGEETLQSRDQNTHRAHGTLKAAIFNSTASCCYST
jgi:hypothetical protein